MRLEEWSYTRRFYQVIKLLDEILVLLKCVGTLPLNLLGSWFHPQSMGFSWVNDFCNLLLFLLACRFLDPKACTVYHLLLVGYNKVGGLIRVWGLEWARHLSLIQLIPSNRGDSERAFSGQNQKFTTLPLYIQFWHSYWLKLHTYYIHMYVCFGICKIIICMHIFVSERKRRMLEKHYLKSCN